MRISDWSSDVCSSDLGGGPSVFAWFASKADAEAAAPAMRGAFGYAGFDARAYVSPVAGPRAEVLQYALLPTAAILPRVSMPRRPTAMNFISTRGNTPPTSIDTALVALLPLPCRLSF